MMHFPLFRARLYWLALFIPIIASPHPLSAASQVKGCEPLAHIAHEVGRPCWGMVSSMTLPKANCISKLVGLWAEPLINYYRGFRIKVIGRGGKRRLSGASFDLPLVTKDASSVLMCGNELFASLISTIYLYLYSIPLILLIFTICTYR